MTPPRLWYGYIRIPGFFWEQVCQDADYMGCWRKLLAAMPFASMDAQVSRQDPGLTERR